MANDGPHDVDDRQQRRQSPEETPTPETPTRSPGAGSMSTENIREINPKLIGGA